MDLGTNFLSLFRLNPSLRNLSLSGILYFSIEIFTSALFLHYLSESYLDEVNSQREDKTEIFDFIIVGGGVTGSVLANRLSEDYKVLLLEFAGTPSPILSVPTFAFASHGRFPVDFQFKTTPQKYSSFGLNDNQTLWPCGKGLGGSSGINGLIYIRGNVQGFDQIANETGDNVWEMNNALRHSRNIEDYHGHFNNPRKGKNGPQSIGKGNLSPFIDNYLKAGEELGYPTRDPNDPYSPLTEGFAPMDFYQRNGRRWGTYEGRLKPILDRKNLKIRRFSHVYKVLIDKNNQARGVEYIRHRRIENAFASKEVILSAGAVHSAKILMLSGIGKKEDLDKLKITTRANLPVGEELQDKYGAFVGPFLVKNGYSFLRERDLTVEAYLNWASNGKGTFSSSRAEATFSICSNLQKIEEGKKLNESCYNPDIHTYVIAQSIDDRVEDLAKWFNFKPNVLNNYFGSVKGQDSFFQLVTLSRPFGTGELKLTDSLPDSQVILNPKYLENRRDMDVLIEGIKVAVDLVEKTESFKKIDGRLIPSHFPGCESFQFKSDEYYECLGRHSTLSAYKYCNTAPINKVVDSRLRVYGIKSLRVADGSVLKEHIVSVNQISCQILGEIASDFIKDHWRNEKENEIK